MNKTYTIHIDPKGLYKISTGEEETEKDRILALRRKKMTYEQIASELNIKTHYIQAACNDEYYVLSRQIAEGISQLRVLGLSYKKAIDYVFNGLYCSDDDICYFKNMVDYYNSDIRKDA